MDNVTFGERYVPGVGIWWEFTRGYRTANLSAALFGNYISCVMFDSRTAESATIVPQTADYALERMRDWLGVMT